MADKAISELVAAEQIKSTDMFVLEQDGTAKRLQGQTLLNWLTAAADGHGGISNIVKTGTDGLVDTYTITLADTTTKTFTVTNGNGLTEFEKLSTVGLVDTYRFTRSDGTYFTFAVSNGAKGDTGDASHVWIKYASQQPTVNSHSIGDNPDDWMGIYSGTAETAPTDWQAYKWYQIKGEKGETGAPATVTGVTVEYIISDSGTIIPSGSWSTTIPSVPQGKYLWTRSTTNFNTGNPVVSYSVTRMGIDGSGSVSSVNDKSPSDSGNVTLTSADIQTSGNTSVQDELDNAVKYNTPQTLTSAQQAQALSNIGGAKSSHNHDSRYYTETEIDTKLSGKSDTNHNHFGQTISPASIELFPGASAGHGGYVDFHYNNDSADYTSRLLEIPKGVLKYNDRALLSTANVAAIYNVHAKFTNGIFEYSNSAIKATSVCFAQYRGSAISSGFQDTVLGVTSYAGKLRIVAKNGGTFETDVNILIINL